MVVDVQLRDRAGARAVIAADPELLAIPRVRKALYRSGIRIVACGCSTGFQALHIVPAPNLALVLAPFPAVSGLSAYELLQKQIALIRPRAQFAPIAFVSEIMPLIDEACLPVGVHVVSADNLDLVRIIHAGDARRQELSWEARNGKAITSPTRAFPVAISGRGRWTARHPTANFNLKHPSMIVPFALAAKRSGLDVFCEVSPQEIALYHGLPACSGHTTALSKALRKVRNYVDEANVAFGTKLRIHLDHCDDLDVLRAACDAGFDTVMADGSGRGLEQNIAFTNAAAQQALPYSVQVEGEVGSIDGGDRWGKTTLEDFARFVEATDIDFVGVSLGQFHGFDYGFAATRSRFAEIEGFDGTVCRDRRALIAACLETYARLQERSVPSSASEFRVLRALAESAMSSARTAFSSDDLLDAQRNNVPFHVRAFVDDIEDVWLSKRKAMTARKKQLWQEIFDTHRHSEARSCLFDHALLCDFIRRLDGARPALVVHGGSSIARSDLECLSRTGVARVNFGTEIFRGYLLALADELPGQRLAAKDDHAVVMPYLECATSSWRDWLEQPPTWVFNYAEKLVANYIRPLADPISAGLGECHVHV